MIPISKEEKDRLVEAFPQYQYPRTMKKDSKRHHYFCTEIYSLMVTIADTNEAARKFVNDYNKHRKYRSAREREFAQRF